MAREMVGPEETGSQPAKTERDTICLKKRQQEEERRFRNVLEDDDVREVLKLSPRKKRLARDNL